MPRGLDIALIEIEAEPFDVVALRGGAGTDAPGAAEAAFRDGMSLYSAGRYREAVAPLTMAHAALPDRDEIVYYLGLDLLLALETDEGIRHLETLAAGSGPFRDRASLRAAEGHLRAGRLEAARGHLARAAEGRGEAAARARDLLGALGAR
jgi:tetratricopeptide (TPR) repeat protein